MHTFAAKEKVQWNKTTVGLDSIGLVKKHGKGPFVIASVRAVDTRCACGAERMGISDHHESCGIHNAESVGHHQHVTIEGVDGSFSGAWFLPVS